MARTKGRRFGLNGFNGSKERFAHVVGWGVDIPEKVLTNDDLTEFMDTNDEWIRTRTGIRERRIADDRDDAASLGLRAARRALRSADILPEEVDLIVVATSSPAYLFPATASVIQDRLGSSRAGAFDILAACSGFIYALSLASSQIRSGAADTVLVIGTETLSRIINWEDRGTAVLFGDGAGAFVLQVSDVPGGITECVMHSDGSGSDLLFAPAGTRPSWNGDHPIPEPFLEMNGREVFRFASRVMASATQEVVQRAGMKLEDIDMIVPHQANLRIIQSAARSLKLPQEKFVVNVEKYGNTSTASIPIALVEAVEDGRIKANDRLVLVGFGGGLTWGAAVVEWAVEPRRTIPGRELMREASYRVAAVRSVVRRAFRYVDGNLFGSPTPKDMPKRVKETEGAEDK